MRNVILLLLVFLGGLLSGALWLQDVPVFMSDSKDIEAVDSIEHARMHLVPGYVCPMHPSVVSNAPDSCPICGMDLVPKNLDEGAGNSEGIAISPAMSNSLGVRIAHAEVGRISEPVFASGNVESVTAATTSEIQATIEGTVKDVYASPGDWVGEGEFIMAIESPGFTELQDSYLAALKIGDYDQVSELRKKLAAMDVRQAVLDGVDRINNTELTPEFIVEAPHSGILEWTAEAGATLDFGQPVARVATSTIARARLRSYARAARAIERGRRAQLDLPHMPGLYWPGRVVEIDHDDAGFYSIIQADFEVPDNATEEGVFVGAYVNAGTSGAALRVPSSAIIRVEGKSRVVRLRGDGQFEPVMVETGFIGNEWAEIRDGLTEGDAVVARAQFLIDSEATLRAGMARMADQ